MNLLKLLESQISTILREEWDPIGIKLISGAKLEYDQYALRIIGFLSRGATNADLMQYLNQVCDELGVRSNADGASHAIRKARAAFDAAKGK